MRYLIILEEYQYNDFEKVNGNLLEIYAIDQNGDKHLFDLRPIQREMVVMPNGASAYITQGHIDAMIKYEHEQHIKEICDRMNHSLDGINDVNLPYHAPLLTPEEIKRQLGVVSPSEYAEKQYAVDPEELKRAINSDKIEYEKWLKPCYYCKHRPDKTNNDFACADCYGYDNCEEDKENG